MALRGEVDIADQLTRVTESLTALVPAIVAFSIGIARHDVTLTYVSSSLEAAWLDGVQYDDGPCQRAARSIAVGAVDHRELLDECRWQLFARAGAAVGIGSSLSLPSSTRHPSSAGFARRGGRPRRGERCLPGGRREQALRGRRAGRHTSRGPGAHGDRRGRRGWRERRSVRSPSGRCGAIMHL